MIQDLNDTLRKLFRLNVTALRESQNDPPDTVLAEKIGLQPPSADW